MIRRQLAFQWRYCTATACLLTFAATLQAKPAHKHAFADYFGPFLAHKLHNCQTCHVPDAANAAPEVADKPHNVFGARLKEVRQILRKSGKKTDLESRLQHILEEDSDGDGATNLVEILTGHAPGDSQDKPLASEMHEYSQKLAAYRDFKSAYPWRPFETVKRPALPAVKNLAWVREPLDAFVAAEHEKRGLHPRPEAEKAVLLRRVHLDLIGLPPTPPELHAFMNDAAPDAYEKVVARLLSSPQYGERWGRHWMDVWRYSDWAGYGQQVRDSKPHIWHWRDWIVESLNGDKGYDRMIVEMLAADELAPEDTDALRATGYLVRNYKLLSREKWLQDTVDHTAQAFLGLTLGCARCHDHMYDAIAQQEYYQMRAVFEPHNVRTDRLPGELDVAKNGLPRAFDADLQAKTFLFVRGDDSQPTKEPLAPGVPQALGGKPFQVAPVSLPWYAHAPEQRPFVIEGLTRLEHGAVARARKASDASRRASSRALSAAVGASSLPSLALWMLAVRAAETDRESTYELGAAESKAAALRATLHVEAIERQGKKRTAEWEQAAELAVAAQRRAAVWAAMAKGRTAERTRQQARSQGGAKLAAAEKAVTDSKREFANAIAAALRPLNAAYAKRDATNYPATSTGRRLALARWIADRDNPLTARVAVNHIWLRHFSQPLVPSVFDFGRNGKPPLLPALLDWLAVEFMESGWNMKQLHRRIVTSNTYRMASTSNAANEAMDPDNRFLWRMPPRRMEAEVVRDCVFYVAHRLDTTFGGPDLDLSGGLSKPRRSLYFRHAQEKQMEFLKLFDCAAVTECYQRKDSVLPQQALALANSELTIVQARHLAHELVPQAAGDAERFTRLAFEQVLSRPPTRQEMETCVEFLRQREQRYQSQPIAGKADDSPQRPSVDPGLHARENLVHVLLNHHDFVTIR